MEGGERGGGCGALDENPMKSNGLRAVRCCQNTVGSKTITMKYLSIFTSKSQGEQSELTHHSPARDSSDMDAGRRRGAGRGLLTGSVWESRMKVDAVNGGIKVFSDKDSGGLTDDGELVVRPSRTAGAGAGVGPERRKRWQPDTERVPLQIRKSGSGAACAGARLRPSLSLGDVGGGKDEEGEEKGRDEEGEEEEIEMADVKEVDANSKIPQIVAQPQEQQQEGAISVASIAKEMDSKDVKSELVNVAEDEKPLPLAAIRKKPANVVVEEKPRISHRKKPTYPPPEKKPLPPPPPPKIEHPTVDPDLSKPPPRLYDEVPVSCISETRTRFQNLVDLVMWRDLSKSALVFGFGTFMLISSSYAKEIHFSFTSGVSYFGLIYLAVRFMHRTFLLRGSKDIKENYHGYMVSEDEAIRLVKMVLPYLNELLLNLRSFFSGEPAATMKLAVVLFVLARCGGSVSMWTMGKLAFFGVFTLPKMYHAYSSQMAAFVRFWMRRFQDAWDSCTHKKIVAAAIFTVVWNLSSVVARLWAVFMLVVSVKLYQQSLHQDAWNKGAETKDGDSGRGQDLKRGEEKRPTTVNVVKEKKAL